LNLPIQNHGQSGCDDGAYACWHPTPNKKRQKSSAAEGEALQEFEEAIQNIAQHHACLAQRGTGLPKKEILLLIPFAL
jgi:hypothetical protein